VEQIELLEKLIPGYETVTEAVHGYFGGNCRCRHYRHRNGVWASIDRKKDVDGFPCVQWSGLLATRAKGNGALHARWGGLIDACVPITGDLWTGLGGGSVDRALETFVGQKADGPAGFLLGGKFAR